MWSLVIYHLLKDKEFRGIGYLIEVWREDSDSGDSHGSSNTVDNIAGIHAGVLRDWVPDLESTVSGHMDIGHRHTGEEDREHTLLAPEHAGSWSACGHAGQSHLLPLHHLQYGIMNGPWKDYVLTADVQFVTFLWSKEVRM